MSCVHPLSVHVTCIAQERALGTVAAHESKMAEIMIEDESASVRRRRWRRPRKWSKMKKRIRQEETMEMAEKRIKDKKCIRQKQTIEMARIMIKDESASARKRRWRRPKK